MRTLHPKPTPTPLTLPTQKRRRQDSARSLTLVDVDNIVLTPQENGASVLDPHGSIAALDGIADRIPATDSSLAVISNAVSRAVSAAVEPLFFRYPEWTWRIAESDEPDAADLELLHHARAISANGGISECFLASGDGIFLELVDIVDELMVIVPNNHRGVAYGLRPFTRHLTSAR